jgi:hypothetical protein
MGRHLTVELLPDLIHSKARDMTDESGLAVASGLAEHDLVRSVGLPALSRKPDRPSTKPPLG